MFEAKKNKITEEYSFRPV